MSSCFINQHTSSTFNGFAINVINMCTTIFTKDVNEHNSYIAKVYKCTHQ